MKNIISHNLTCIVERASLSVIMFGGCRMMRMYMTAMKRVRQFESRGDTVVMLVEERARTLADKTCFKFETRTWTYRDVSIFPAGGRAACTRGTSGQGITPLRRALKAPHACCSCKRRGGASESARAIDTFVHYQTPSPVQTRGGTLSRPAPPSPAPSRSASGAPLPFLCCLNHGTGLFCCIADLLLLF